MTTSSLDIRAATLSDMPACAAILNEWIDDTEWMPRIHPIEDVERHYCETVFAERKTIVADNAGALSGLLTVSPDAMVTAFYVRGRSRSLGIGRRLLCEAKRLFADGLSLWTFQANTQAQRFYRREDFTEVRRTDGDNEEGLPDILFRWTRTCTRTGRSKADG